MNHLEIYYDFVGACVNEIKRSSTIDNHDEFIKLWYAICCSRVEKKHFNCCNKDLATFIKDVRAKI